MVLYVAAVDIFPYIHNLLDGAEGSSRDHSEGVTVTTEDVMALLEQLLEEAQSPQMSDEGSPTETAEMTTPESNTPTDTSKSSA